MKLRKIIFWLHLIAGVSAGIVVFIMSVTGVALTYQKQMTEWADRAYWPEPAPAGAARLPVETLLVRVREAAPEAAPANITFYSDPAAPAMLAAGGRTFFVNRYTGELGGEGSQAMRGFFRFMTDWHRYLAQSGDRRPFGRSITGACNLAFLFIVISGFYMWWPRQWSSQALGAVTVFKRGLSGRARDFNWHNVFGFWTALPLFFIVLSGTIMSYPWANRMVYRLTGSPVPVQGGGPVGTGGTGGAAGPAPQQRAVEGAPQAERNAEAPPRGGQGEEATPRGGQNLAQGNDRRPEEGPRAPGAGRRPAAVDLTGVDVALARAEQQVERWRTIGLRIPAATDDRITFTVDRGYGGQPQLRSTVVIGRATGEVVRLQTFADQNAGQQARTWFRFVHTGEFYGLVGQTVAGIASFAGAMLVFTGLSLALRRLRAWIRRKSRSQPVTEAAVLVEETTYSDR